MTVLRIYFSGSNSRTNRIFNPCGTYVITAILWLLPWVAFGQLGSATVTTGMPPAWVEWTASEPGTTIQPGQESGGQTYALIDSQVSPAQSEAFIHVGKEITSEAGVQSGANLTFTWDPSFQELIVHRVTIQRGADEMDRLDPARFKIIQQETDLNRQIYNGALSAVLFLEDVRVGDRIDYAFSVRGENPSLKGRYVDSFILGATVPIQHRRLRLLWPEGRQLYFQLHGMAVEPQIRAHGDKKEYIWDLHEMPAVAVEDQVPSWFPVYPWIQLSEFTSWSEVAEWAAALYVTTNSGGTEVNAAIAKLRRAHATAEQTVQGALEFAQNDIRYLGIEFGPNSYHPSDPLIVLRRRFGDCKDKAFLLCTLLRGLGYDALPVLVATGYRHTLPDMLPAPNDFDHVIVRVVADGKTYWVDPTRSYQRGPITQRYLPEYSFGLLVRAGEGQLIQIPVSDAGTPESATTEIFRISGQRAPAHLNVKSVFSGFDAEWIRSILASEGRDRLAKAYLNDYAQRYPGIIPSAPMTTEDSPNSDTLSLIHTYSINNFWTLSADKQRYTCQFYPDGIHTWIRKPTSSLRSMPMELSFPRKRSVHTRIELPREFKLSNFTNTVASPGAELQVRRAYSGQTLWLDYEYRALTNFVPAGLTASHLASLDRMESVLGYSLTWQNMDGVGNTSQFNWPIFLLAVAYTTILSIGAVLLCRRQSRPLPANPSATPPLLDRELNGLGGWLILVGIRLFLFPPLQIAQIARGLGSFSLWKWHGLTNRGEFPTTRYLASC
jgi:hypothetical protein